MTQITNKFLLRNLRKNKIDVNSISPEWKGFLSSMELYFDHVNERQVMIDRSLKLSSDELRDAKKKAEETAKVKHEFLANMSHEIRTPMNGVVGMIEMLIENTSLSKEQQEYVDIIQRSSMDLLDILNDILDLTKLEAGKIEVIPSPSSIRQTVEKVEGLFKAIAAKKNIKISHDIPENIPKVLEFDNKKVTQILSNLVGNAIKFTESGTIQVTVKQIENSQLKIEVIDSGIGISDDDINKLFRQFSQLENTNIKTVKGTGLGLALCKQLSELLNGNIGVESTIGKGSKFWFTFNTQITDQKNKHDFNEHHHNLNTSKFNKHILLVDDKDVNIMVAQLMLKKLGCSFEIARNGLEAVETYKKGTFDAILMDIQMPVMDGIEASKEIKKLAKNTPPIIGLSANVMESDKERYLNNGLDDYISKPATLEAFQKSFVKWFKQ